MISTNMVECLLVGIVDQRQALKTNREATARSW